MAAPDFVPTAAVPATRKAYTSPPSRIGGWRADRPGDIAREGQPTGAGLGYQGPDQGFALRLMRQFEGRILLADGEHRSDVVAGCVAVAMRRASLFGRAPMKHDIEVALTLFGFLDDAPDEQLVRWRKERFAELSHTAQHYTDARDLVNEVPEEALRLPAKEVLREYDRNWQSLLEV